MKDDDQTPKRTPHGWSYMIVGVIQGLLLTLLIFLLML